MTKVASTALIGRLKPETTMAIAHRSADRRAVARSTKWECCWWNFQVWSFLMTCREQDRARLPEPVVDTRRSIGRNPTASDREAPCQEQIG